VTYCHAFPCCQGLVRVRMYAAQICESASVYLQGIRHVCAKWEALKREVMAVTCFGRGGREGGGMEGERDDEGGRETKTMRERGKGERKKE